MNPRKYVAITILITMAVVSLLVERNSLKLYTADVVVEGIEATNPRNIRRLGGVSDVEPSLATVQDIKVPMESVPINPNSTISSDIFGIWHDPVEAAVCVHLKKDARCPHPAFRGRLSGPSLTILDWIEREDDTLNGTITCGSYRKGWLLPGKYFLDVIVLFCDDFGVGSLARRNESEWLSFDFKPVCMEAPDSNQVTQNAYVSIHRASSGIGDLSRGRWVSSSANMPAIPLHTRYQPLHCRRVPDLPRCAGPMNDTQLKAYSFQWMNNSDSLWTEKIERASKMKTNLPKVCVVGFSHSRDLVSSFNRIGLGRYFAHVQARYPFDVGPWLLNNSYVKHGCTEFIIGVAQWPGSMMQGFPYLFDQYLDEMRRIAGSATSVLPNGAKPRIHMRSVHLIPIGDVTGKCPIPDWRSPTVMDGYSHLIKKAVTELKNNRVHYLDTSFITSPMWDSASDWVHLPPQVSDVEALYMAAKVFHFNQKLAL